MKALNLILILSFLGLTACELPDVEGLNSMPHQTDKMAKKMEETNEGIRMQKVGEGLKGLNDPNNQKLIQPLPVGLMPWGVLFAENANVRELIEMTYLWTREVEEILPISGINKEGDMVEPTEEDLNKIRVQKTARLYTLMIVAGSVPDQRVDEIINTHIRTRSRFFKVALNFLAFRAYYLREVMLKTSLKIDSSSDGVLETSGMMDETIKYLLKLDKISRLPYANQIGFSINEKYYNMIKQEELQNAAGRQKTADMWKLALEKAQAGQQSVQVAGYNHAGFSDADQEQEIAQQNRAMNVMKSYIKSWEGAK